MDKTARRRFFSIKRLKMHPNIDGLRDLCITLAKIWNFVDAEWRQYVKYTSKGAPHIHGHLKG